MAQRKATAISIIIVGVIVVAHSGTSGCRVTAMSILRASHPYRHRLMMPMHMTTAMAAHSPLPLSESSSSHRREHPVSSENIHSSPPTTSTTQDYWKLRTQRRQYERDNKILYVKSALTPSEFATISSELSFMMQTDSNMMPMQEEDASSSFATNRIGARVPTNSNIYNNIGSVCRLVNGLYDNTEMILAPNIPIEVRVYEKAGAGMGWHIDDVLYSPRQVEIVLTLDNTSDCCTMWRVPKMENDDTVINDDDDDASPSSHCTDKTTTTASAGAYTVHSIQTVPNSILILESGGVEHKVTPLSYGKRTILKMAFVSKDAVMDESMKRHVSHHHHHHHRTRTAAADQKKMMKKRRR